MILAVCLNPASDITYRSSALERGESHHVTVLSERAGGKGVNVARVLHQLGEAVTLTGLIAGSRGQTIGAELEELGLATAFVEIEGQTRRSITVTDPQEATVFNEPGPTVREADWGRFLDGFENLLAEADVLTLSGSVPRGIGDDAYAELVRRAGAAGVPAIVDAYGVSLSRALGERPAVVAPNRAEAAGVLGIPATDLSGVEAGRAFQARGAGAAVISSGAEGLTALTPSGSWSANPPFLVSGNPTGAGDALTAALARGVAHRLPWPAVIADCVAWAAGAVAVPWAGEIDEEVAADVRSRVIIREIE